MFTYGQYKLAKVALESFTRSSVRIKIMLCLMDNGQNSLELEKELGIVATTILHTLKGMAADNLVVRTGREYTLTNLGMLQAQVLDELVKVLAMCDQHRDFFLTHDISSIPVGHQKMIWMLYQPNPIVSDSAMPLYKLELLMKEMRRAKELYCVSSVITPGYIDGIANAIRRGAKVNLILTGTVLQAIRDNSMNLITELFGRANLRIYRAHTNDINMAFMVTESQLFMGLRRFDGCYDLENIMVCEGGGPIEWGFNLFEYYKVKSALIRYIEQFAEKDPLKTSPTGTGNSQSS